MQFKAVTFVCTLIAMLSVALNTVALPVVTTRDVFDPRITFPPPGSVFMAGQSITVTWDTSELPLGLQNKGMIVLGSLTEDSENLDIDHPLASDFLLTDGSHAITFSQDLETKPNYIVALFGDSGNISPTFTIEGLY